MSSLEAIPADVVRGHLLPFLTPARCAVLALVSRRARGWAHPVLAFFSTPLRGQVDSLRRHHHHHIARPVILRALARHHDPVPLMPLLDDHAWRDGVRAVVETQIRDRSCRTLVKGAIVGAYLGHLDRCGDHDRIETFLQTIQSPEVLSRALEQHALLLLKKDDDYGACLRVAERIPDALTRGRVLRRIVAL